MSEYYTAKEVAPKVGVKPQTVRVWARNGIIPSYKPHGKYLFKKTKIDKWLEKKKGAYVKNTD